MLRSYILIILVTLGSVSGACANVQHWTPQAVFGMISVAALTLAAGIQKSPHDVTSLVAGQLLSTAATLQPPAPAEEPPSTATPSPAEVATS